MKIRGKKKNKGRRDIMSRENSPYLFPHFKHFQGMVSFTSVFDSRLFWKFEDDYFREKAGIILLIESRIGAVMKGIWRLSQIPVQ